MPISTIENYKKIYMVIKVTPAITFGDLQRTFPNLSPGKLNREIRRLVKMGEIKNIGARKHPRWVVTTPK